MVDLRDSVPSVNNNVLSICGCDGLYAAGQCLGVVSRCQKLDSRRRWVFALNRIDDDVFILLLSGL